MTVAQRTNAQSARRARHQRRGQALAEVALILPLVVILVLGVYSVSELISVQNSATTATRNGARLAAQFGNGGYVIGSSQTDPTTLDDKIVANVVAGMGGTNTPSGTTVVEVDVYKPDSSQAAGYFNPCGSDPKMLIDRYKPDGTPLSTCSSQYTLDQRNDVLGAASPIGVRVVYNYTPPTVIFAWMGGQKSAYTVMYIQPL